MLVDHAKEGDAPVTGVMNQCRLPIRAVVHYPTILLFGLATMYLVIRT